ncbi:sucrase ferredoxin [Myxacorys almedinensis A]|uniref:Sucrase ferredoxin n=2 Tax=Myxacorys TaxID=2056239 RepID=A0A8J8CNH1_9CYAN|nr:sucrase ferredoxin [Myxacorys almedinensis A]
MPIDNSPSSCQFCSVISKTSGEDPIGSVEPSDYWLVMEMPLPWVPQRWLENPTLQPILMQIRSMRIEHEIKLRVMAIAPDHQYSQPGLTRVLFYRRPARLFAQFEKQEFLIPDAEVGHFTTTLLKHLLDQQSYDLSQFDRYQQDTSHIHELMICTHGNVDVACARFGYPIYQTLRQDYAAVSNGQLRVWRVSHFGGHQFAPTLVDLPEGRYWGHLEPEMLDLLVHRNGSVAGLRPFYRGWAGLGKFEQIAEREIWMQEGWDWLTYEKSGCVLAIDESNELWADVQIDFVRRNLPCAYKARVEVNGFVMTAHDSGKTPSFQEVKQYHVTHLVRV